MNFYFGHIHDLSKEQAHQRQIEWLNKTIFAQYENCISTHAEDGFSLTLVNDPKKLYPDQSERIYVNDDFVCATDCQLFNKTELADKLDLDPDSKHEEFFISAYLKWGEQFPNVFDGKFSFIIWDRNDRILLAGLDALGYCSFSYSWAGQHLYFASDLATLLDQPRVDKSINLNRFYQCFRYSNNTPEQTYFKHCNYCPASHVVKVQDDKIKTQDYWKLTQTRIPKKSKTESQYTDEYISILAGEIKKQVGKDQKIGLMLSGGNDSSLLAAILSTNSEFRQKLISYSYVFDKFKSCDESEYVRQTLKILNINGKLINCDDKIILSDLDTRLITKDIVHLDSYAALPESIYSQAHADHQNVLMSGLNGDDLFGGFKYLYADLIRQRHFLQIIKSLLNSTAKFSELSKLLNFGIRPSLPQQLKRIYRKISKTSAVHDFSIPDEYLNHLDDEKALKECKLFQHEKLLKLVYYRNIPEGLHFLRRHLYLRYSLGLTLPYYNKKMIEYMWRLPVQYLSKRGKFRGIQINSLERFKLDHIINRTSKTNFGELIETGILENKKAITNLRKSSLLVDEKMINAKELDLMINQIGDINKTHRLRFFLLTELWFRAIRSDDSSYNDVY